MSNEDATNEWHMAGTENTGDYKVIAMNSAGRLGIRLLAGGSVRIRIESTDEGRDKLEKSFVLEEGWKQPDYTQQRFSKVLPNGPETIQSIVNALKVLEKSGGKLTRNSAERRWRMHVA
jgi:hypothetical protein